MRQVRVILLALMAGGLALVQTGVSTTIPLTIAEARSRAIAYNRSYLQAQEDLAKAKAQIVTARAGVLPDISAFGGYTRNLMIPSFFIFGTDSTGKSFKQEFTTGSDNQFAAGITVKQPIFRQQDLQPAVGLTQHMAGYKLWLDVINGGFAEHA